MVELISVKEVKARKEHVCMFCGGNINKGEKYEYSTCKYDDRIYPWKTHLKCKDIAQELEMYDDGEGVDGQKFSDFINEYLSENMSEEEWEDCDLCGEEAVDKVIEMLKGNEVK